MSTPLIAGIIVLAIIAAIALVQRKGPRVTTIEHKRVKRDDDVPPPPAEGSL